MHKNTIGNRLREERQRLGFNQTEFAECGGVKKLAQVNYESDKRVPDGAYLVAIAQVGVDVHYVLFGQRTIVIPEKNGLEDSEDQELMKMFGELTTEQRRAVIEVSKVFSQPKPNKTAG